MGYVLPIHGCHTREILTLDFGARPVINEADIERPQIMHPRPYDEILRLQVNFPGM